MSNTKESINLDEQRQEESYTMIDYILDFDECPICDTPIVLSEQRRIPTASHVRAIVTNSPDDEPEVFVTVPVFKIDRSQWRTQWECEKGHKIPEMIKQGMKAQDEEDEEWMRKRESKTEDE
jgi:hypothetical protein